VVGTADRQRYNQRRSAVALTRETTLTSPTASAKCRKEKKAGEAQQAKALQRQSGASMQLCSPRVFLFLLYCMMVLQGVGKVGSQVE